MVEKLISAKAKVDATNYEGLSPGNGFNVLGAAMERGGPTRLICAGFFFLCVCVFFFCDVKTFLQLPLLCCNGPPRILKNEAVQQVSGKIFGKFERCHNVCSSEKNTLFEQQNDSSGAVLHVFEWMFLFFLCLDDDDDDGK